jgi:transketolase
MDFKHTKLGYSQALVELAEAMPELVVLDADVSKATSTCDFESRFPDRFFNCGTAEQNELSVAAGLALEGLLPFASTFGMFATGRAADQFRNSIAYPNLNVKIGATHSGLTTGGDGASHQANEDIAMARALPNVTVLVPGDIEEARLATLAAARHQGPCYLRFGRDQYPVVPEIHSPVEIGKAKILRPGGRIVVVSTGILVSEAIQACDQLERSGVRAGLLHYPCVKPFDVETLVQMAKGAVGVVTAEEHSIIGGLGEAVASCLAEHCPRPVRRVGVMDCFGESGQAQELMDRYGLRAEVIVEQAQAILRGAVS